MNEKNDYRQSDVTDPIKKDIEKIFAILEDIRKNGTEASRIDAVSIQQLKEDVIEQTRLFRQSHAENVLRFVDGEKRMTELEKSILEIKYAIKESVKKEFDEIKISFRWMFGALISTTGIAIAVIKLWL